MQRIESVRILVRIEPVDSDDIPIVFDVRVAERDLRRGRNSLIELINDTQSSHRPLLSLYLIAKAVDVDVIHSLEMRVKRVDDCEGNFQQILDDEAQRHIVREADFISDGN